MRSYGGEPATERQDRRRALLMDAAQDLIWNGERLTVRAVCQTARLNDRYFYENFASTDELLVACWDAAIAATLEVLSVATLAAEGDIEDRARSTVSTTLQHLIDNPKSTRVMIEGRISPALAERRAQLISTVVRMFVTSADPKQPAEKAPVSLRLAGLTVVNGALETTALWLAGEVDATRNELIDHLVAALRNAVVATATR